MVPWFAFWCWEQDVKARKELNDTITSTTDIQVFMPSKFDNWLSKHPILESLYPWVAGVVLWLLVMGAGAGMWYGYCWVMDIF